jgi:hypothetical protein
LTLYNEVIDSHIALSTGDDAGGGSGLTAWLNAYIDFIAAELIPADLFLGWNFTPNSKLTNKHGSMSTSMVSDRYSTKRKQGVWKSKHAFQTAQFIYWLMGGCTTTEGTPAGYNTHVVTVKTGNVPRWHGIKFEREGIAANALRYAMMGLLPSDLTINCGEKPETYDAIQEITVPYAYLNRAAANIAKQTDRPSGTIGSIWKDWNSLIVGNGAGKSANLTGMLYNGNSLEFDHTHLSLQLHRNTKFTSPITHATTAISGTPSVGLMGLLDYKLIFDAQPIGNTLYDLCFVDKEDYAGDLDFDFYFKPDATNDNIRFVFDKMYMVPFDEVNDYDKYIEGYKITFEPLDRTSSLTVTGIDNLNNNHMENP